MKPAVAVLSTGSVCFPLNRPVLAFHQPKVCVCAVILMIRLSHTCVQLTGPYFELQCLCLCLECWQVGSSGLMSHVQ